LATCWAGISTGWRRVPAWVAALRPPLPGRRASVRSIDRWSARWRRAVFFAAPASADASGRDRAPAVFAGSADFVAVDRLPVRFAAPRVGPVVLLRAIAIVPPGQPALRVRVPDFAAFFAGAFFALAALRGAAFLAAFFVAVFFAGVRLLSFRLFCSSETKSTTLVAALSSGSSSTWVVAPLSLIRLRMISARRSRNSSW